MNEKKAKSHDDRADQAHQDRLLEELYRDFPRLRAEIENPSGPVDSLFRAPAVACLPLAMQPVFRAVGRSFARLLQELLDSQPAFQRRKMPLQELAAAVAEELGYSARVLAAGFLAHQQQGKAGADPELEQLFQRSFQRLARLARELSAVQAKADQ